MAWAKSYSPFAVVAVVVVASAVFLFLAIQRTEEARVNDEEARQQFRTHNLAFETNMCSLLK